MNLYSFENWNFNVDTFDIPRAANFECENVIGMCICDLIRWVRCFDLSDQGNSKESWLPVCEDNKMIYKYFPFTETDGLQLS